MRAFLFGAIAQLGEHLHGMQGVGGSIPPSSTRPKGKTGHPGRYMIHPGIVLIAAGLIGGFTAMFQDADSVAALLTGTLVSRLCVKQDPN